MLDAFIIEELKKREHEKRERQRPAVELPRIPEKEAPREKEEQAPRGVIILQT